MKFKGYIIGIDIGSDFFALGLLVLLLYGAFVLDWNITIVLFELPIKTLTVLGSLFGAGNIVSTIAKWTKIK